MEEVKRVEAIINALEQQYPQDLCSLQYDTPHELLIAVRLSAQCTDARVNMVVPALFRRYRSVGEFADADPAEVENYIRSCGFYHTKAQDIVAMCRKIRDEFGGKVPDNIEDLTTLPGVGRKTANLICGDVYGKPSYVCDTHCIRITNLLGLSSSKDPYKVEMQLRACIPPEKSTAFCHRMVLLGREFCIARRPRCIECPLKEFCPAGMNFTPKGD